MDEVCVGLGYCGSTRDGKRLHVTMFIPDAGDVTADQFVEWLFLADRDDPQRNPKLTGEIRSAFVRHMGAEVVDARALRWDG